MNWNLNASRVMEVVLSRPEERATVLGQLVRSAQTAGSIAPSAWSTTLYPNGFRLNVGQVEALTFRGGILRVLLLAPSADPRLGGLPVYEGVYVPVRGDHSAFVGDITTYERSMPILEPLHLAYIDNAARTKSGRARKGTSFAHSHSKELMEYAAAEVQAVAPERQAAYPFHVDEEYTRRDVFRILSIPDHNGGPWFTGYARHENDWFIFCGVGAAGRTGHDYGNHFDGDRLIWFAKGGSHQQQPSVQSMLHGDGRVYVFYREDDRDAFVFAGLASPVAASGNDPVQVTWAFEDPHGLRLPSALAEELPNEDEAYFEGKVQVVRVNKYERSPDARRKCIRHWRPICRVCEFDFEAIYGPLGKGYIHVHHIKPMSETRGEYQVDPVKDLRPVCPNCHAMLHRQHPPISIEDLRAMLNEVQTAPRIKT